MSYAGWHIASLYCLADQPDEHILCRLLSEPEYLAEVASALAQELRPVATFRSRSAFPFEKMWNARENPAVRPPPTPRHLRLVQALQVELMRQFQRRERGEQDYGSLALAGAIAAVDPAGFSVDVLTAIQIPSSWTEYTKLAIVENLLLAGVLVPSNAAFELADAVNGRGNWLQDSDRTLLLKAISMCAFVDDPAAGIAKMRSLLETREFWGYEFRDVIKALGESRCELAVSLLEDLAKRGHAYEQCEEEFLTALLTLDTQRAQLLLSGLVDVAVGGLPSSKASARPEFKVALLIDLVRKNQAIRLRFHQLCCCELPPQSRWLLAATLGGLGDTEAIESVLNLIDDEHTVPIPQGIWDLARAAFLEEKPYGAHPNSYTVHARAANSLRQQLFRMALNDSQRRRSAIHLLAHIEEYRMERGRPHDEPRHPDVESRRAWPLIDAA